MSTSKRWYYLLFGTVVAAFAMSMINHSNLGTVMTTVLWDGMAKQMGITIGQASYITSVVMILFLIFYDRRQIQLGTVVNFLLYGAAMDFFQWLLPDAQGLTARIVLAVVGIVILSIGIGIYAYANLGRGPYEGLGFALAEKNRWQLRYVRIALDFLFLFAGFMLGGAVGVSTIISAVISGVIIQATTTLLDRINHLGLSEGTQRRGL